MVAVIAAEGYPTSVAELGMEIGDASKVLPMRLGIAALVAGRRISVQKSSGEILIGQMASRVDRTTICLRPDETDGRYGPAELVEIDKGTNITPHPQAHLPGIDFDGLIVSRVPRIIPAQTRLL